MTQRTAFVLSVRPDKIDQYIQAHKEVWPEMLGALREAGIRNYTIFRHGNEMFGYFEADDLDAAANHLERQTDLDTLAGRNGGAPGPACPGRRTAGARRGLPPRLSAKSRARRGLSDGRRTSPDSFRSGEVLVRPIEREYVESRHRG